MTRPFIVRTSHIDMDIWWHRLTDEKRDEFRALVSRIAGPRWYKRIEYNATPNGPVLRFTAKPKERSARNGNYVSLIDPSCICGPGGRPIHLWEYTIDVPLTEPLPEWWQPEGEAA